jgi:hypothetical protein
VRSGAPAIALNIRAFLFAPTRAAEIKPRLREGTPFGDHARSLTLRERRNQLATTTSVSVRPAPRQFTRQSTAGEERVSDSEVSRTGAERAS